LLDFNLRRLGLTKQSKICSITHASCMDGSISQLLLEQTFRNITSISSKYDNYRDELIKSEIESGKYDFIFLTDISPIDPEVLKNQNRVILLDHHASALYHYNAKENKYVIPDKFSGSSLTKRFIEEYFGIPLKHMNNLVYLSQDYDLWKKNSAKSTFLNEIHFFYYSDGFKKRFYGGDTRFKPDEIEYIRKRKVEFKETYDDLEVYELGKIKGCYVQVSNFINEICEKLIKEKYDIVFCKSPNKNNVSVRCKKGFVNIGEVLKELGYGGGHPEAGGFQESDFLKTQEKIKKIEERIYEEVKRKKK
jgi:DHH family putative phosphoesterase